MERVVEKSVLGLELPSDPRWAKAASMNIGEILIDHAWCEQKAATTCITHIIKFGTKYPIIVEKLSPIVSEEWTHFRMVIKELEKRNIPLGIPRKDDYVIELFKCIRTGKEEHILDRLLASALIEARSCERFKLISEEINDEELKSFYKELVQSEAGHYRLFIDLATSIFGEKDTDLRWREFLKLEAEIISNLVIRDDRLH